MTGVDAQLELEILKAERLRASALAIIGAVLGTGSVVANVLFGEFFESIFAGNAVWIMSAAVLGTLVLYQLAARAGFGWLLARERPLPMLARYGHALVETSFVTVALVLLAGYVHPAFSLTAPPVLLYFVFIALSALRLDPWLCMFTGLVAGIGYLFAVMLAFANAPPLELSPVLAAFPPFMGRAVLMVLTGIATGVVAHQIRKRMALSLQLVEERNEVVSKFGQHVSPQVVDKILAEKKELHSESRSVCVMFLDIRNFTTFCEGKTPEEVVSHLNHLFGFMVEIVDAHSGIINKFLGDGFMAFFGAPLSDGRDCDNALAASRAILTRMEQERHEGTIGTTRVGIGLHVGDVMTGTVGSRRRKEYTVIGDAVNLAARIEGLNKQHASELLISEAVRASLENPDAVAMEDVGAVQVKGRAEPVHVFKVA